MINKNNVKLIKQRNLFTKKLAKTDYYKDYEKNKQKNLRG